MNTSSCSKKLLAHPSAQQVLALSWRGWLSQEPNPIRPMLVFDDHPQPEDDDGLIF